VVAASDVYSPIAAPLRAAWAERVRNPPDGLTGARRLWRIIREGRGYPCVILDASEKEGVLAAALLGRRRRPPTVLLAEATWKRGRNPLDRVVSRLGLPLVDGPHVYYAVLSTLERQAFPRTWGVDPRRVVFTPYHYTLSESELRMPTREDGSIFAGGDSLRDYAVLAEAMCAVPHPLVIATRRRGGRWRQEAPANVTVRATSPAEYNRRTAAASVVVVPMEARTDRSAGQATYLNAMVLGKPVVVSDVAGARDHIRDGETGVLVPPGDPAALAAALRGLLEDRGRARRIGAAAKRDVLDRFGPDRYVERLLAVVDRASGRAARA
jgi:glycosyltransferase involved in cell wall biosynthesis